MWERDICHVANNSRWRVMAETSNLIETEYPDKGYYGLAYSIARAKLYMKTGKQLTDAR